MNKRNIWLPKLTVQKLEKLLSKSVLTENDKEDLLDYKYMLINDTQSAVEKGFMIEVLTSRNHDTFNGKSYTPKNKSWITNINHRTEGVNL